MNKKKYSWYGDCEFHSPETFESKEIAVTDAIESYTKEEKTKVIEIWEVDTLDGEDFIDNVIEAITDSNESFAMESGVDPEVIIDNKDEFKKSLESLIKKHCSFNPTWIPIRKLGRYDLSQNE